ncbi:hypothetical protein E4U53_006411, partial [Claviceps sorghi]
PYSSSTSDSDSDSDSDSKLATGDAASLHMAAITGATNPSGRRHRQWPCHPCIHTFRYVYEKN